jgi:hypothetical protein
MKRVGYIFLGVGFGILCYVIFTLFFKSGGVVSPVEESSVNKVIQQNSK